PARGRGHMPRRRGPPRRVVFVHRRRLAVARPRVALAADLVRLLSPGRDAAADAVRRGAGAGDGRAVVPADGRRGVGPLLPDDRLAAVAAERLDAAPAAAQPAGGAAAADAAGARAPRADPAAVRGVG